MSLYIKIMFFFNGIEDRGVIAVLHGRKKFWNGKVRKSIQLNEIQRNRIRFF